MYENIFFTKVKQNFLTNYSFNYEPKWFNSTDPQESEFYQFWGTLRSLSLGFMGLH